MGSFDPSNTDRESLLRALGDLEGALDANVERAGRMKLRIAQIRDALSSGRPLRDIVPAEEPPLLPELLSQSVENLSAYGSRVRRLEARALHREGMTMEQIAQLFGVTRQRVAALLRDGS